jgi:hypothetical protein
MKLGYSIFRSYYNCEDISLPIKDVIPDLKEKMKTPALKASSLSKVTNPMVHSLTEQFLRFYLKERSFHLRVVRDVFESGTSKVQLHKNHLSYPFLHQAPFAHQARTALPPRGSLWCRSSVA